MSLEIQDKFAASFAKHSWNLNNWQVLPQQIGHVFMDYFSAWVGEHKNEDLGEDYTHSPHPEPVVRKMFGQFFKSLEERNHIFVPNDLREASIQEYLED